MPPSEVCVTTAATIEEVEPSSVVLLSQHKNLSVKATSRLSPSKTTAATRSSSTAARSWQDVYIPPPIVYGSTIGLAGLVLFLLACWWPPLLLLLAYVLSVSLPYMVRITDSATNRRRLFAEFARHHAPREYKKLEKCTTARICAAPSATRENDQRKTQPRIEESYWINSRGMALSTVILLPPDDDIKALVCFCHGYTDNCSYWKRVEYQRMVKKGIAVAMIEYEGHGRSDGILGLVTDWKCMVEDVVTYFKQVCQRFANVPHFLMGESMGGAVAFLSYQPTLFKGVILCSPMCKISDELLPPQWLIDFLAYWVGPQGTTSVLGLLPIAPSTGSVNDGFYHYEEKRLLLQQCPLLYDRNPRLATARELLDMTSLVSSQLHTWKAPCLILHGCEDKVTDPALSRALYDEAPSTDKTLKLYPGMWHTLLAGERDEDIDVVFDDICNWILERS